MRFEHLYYLSVLSQHKSLNAASEQLHITQQTLSSALKNMEKEFNTTLFTRTPQGVYLTIDGEIFMETAMDILAKLEHFTMKYATSPHRSLSGNITLYCNWSANNLLVPHILTSQYMNHPNLAIDVHPLKTKLVLKSCVENPDSLGLFFCRANFLAENPLMSELTVQPLISCPVVLLVHPQSPLAKLPHISLNKISNQKLVLFENDYDRRYSLSHLIKNYTDAKILLTKNYNLCNQMVHDQLALTLTIDTNPSVKQQDDGLVKVPLTDQFHITAYLAFSPATCNEEGIHALYKLLEEVPLRRLLNNENNTTRISGSSI